MNFEYNTSTTVRYILCGQLTARNFIHMRRNIDLQVLIIVQQGIFNIEIDGIRRKVHPNEYIILPAKIYHEGWEDEDTEQNLRYFWVHFLFNGEYSLGMEGKLPMSGSLDSYSRVSILTKQLLDISQIPGTDINYCNFLLSALLCELTAQTSGAKHGENKLVNNIISWINLNIHDNISLSDAAAAFGYDKKYIARLFRKHTGRTVNQLITDKKIGIAKQYLTGSDEYITSIAERLGYNDAGYFMRLFKKHEGITCSEYRSAYSKMYLNRK